MWAGTSVGSPAALVNCAAAAATIIKESLRGEKLPNSYTLGTAWGGDALFSIPLNIKLHVAEGFPFFFFF